MDGVNNNLVLIVGKPATGKSASLRNIKDPEGVLFLNCESGKELPFSAKFRQMKVTDPNQIYVAFEKAEANKKIHTIIIDSITFMMDMYESMYVLTASDKERFKAWADYGDFWRKLMHKYVAGSSKNVIMLAHTMDQLNENEGVMETKVKFKGSVMNQGVESYFCVVIASQKLQLAKVERYKNTNLTITKEEELLGFKYMFQTRLTKETVNNSLRGPLGLWSIDETYIDNDAQFVLDKLHAYYTN